MKFFYVSKSADEQIVSGIVMQGTPPELEADPYIDSQGDWCKMAALQKASHQYMEAGSFEFDINHKGKNYEFEILESYVVSEDDVLKFGIELKKGAWLMTLRIDDGEIWQKIKSGELEGFSVLGTANSPGN